MAEKDNPNNPGKGDKPKPQDPMVTAPATADAMKSQLGVLHEVLDLEGLSALQRAIAEAKERVAAAKPEPKKKKMMHTEKKPPKRERE